jgi:mannose-1-phosphate guanylyltransferase
MVGSPWAVILAGGDGQRVSELTRGSDGRTTPKQYWRFGGQPPMVQWAIDRARRVIPDERILVVVNEGHRQYWENDLAHLSRHNLLVQPCNRGTAAGVMLALMTILVRSEEQGAVVFLPSDHFVANEDLLQGAIETALGVCGRGDADMALLGMEPSEQDREVGWIVPTTEDRVTRVGQFVEKPPADGLPALRQAGGLVNSFVFASRAQTMVDLIERAVPQFARQFRAHLRYPIGLMGVHHLYDAISSTDLSRQVLQALPELLSVVRVPPCGWSDLGTPDRMMAFMSRLGALKPLPARGPARRRAVAVA